MAPERLPAGLPAATEGDRPDRACIADPPSVTGVELRRAAEVTHPGRGPVPDPAPSHRLPSRRPRLDWSRAVQDIPDGEVVTYGVAVLDQAGNPAEILIAGSGGWPTARAAEDYARQRADTAGYRVVPLQQVADP